MNDEIAQRFWRKQATLVTLRRNFACWLEAFLPALLGSTVVFACALLILRKMDANPRGAWIGYGVFLLISALVGLIAARRRFFVIADALVRLEASLHLHNRLTAA